MPDPVDLHVVTFNLRYGTAPDGWHHWRWRRRLLVRWLRRTPWDVAGFQEVIPRQRRYLTRRLRGSRWYGVGRADGTETGDPRGEQSCVAVRSDRWVVEHWRTAWLSDTPEEVGSRGWDADFPRVATLLHLRGRDGVGLHVVNTHFDHVGVEARHRSAAMIADLVRADPADAWVVMGDLNCGPTSEPVATLESAGLRQVLPPDAPGTEHAWTGRTDRHRIDHVLVSDAIEVEDADVVHPRPWGVLLSDHWPVAAHLRVTG